MNRLFSWLSAFIGHDSHSPIDSERRRPCPSVVLDSAWSTYQMHWSALDVLDQKASALIALVGVMVALLISFQPEGLSYRSWHGWLSFIGLLALALSAFCSMSAYRVRTVDLPVKPSDVLKYFEHPGLEDPERETTEMLVRSIDKAIDATRPISILKIRRLGWSHNCLMTGIVFIIAAYLAR